jgi:hypothetical protein
MPGRRSLAEFTVAAPKQIVFAGRGTRSAARLTVVGIAAKTSTDLVITPGPPLFTKFLLQRMDSYRLHAVVLIFCAQQATLNIILYLVC